MDPSAFVLLADYVPGIIQEIRYYSTYNFVGERIDGYEEPCALLTKEAARALKAAAGEMNVHGYRLKVSTPTGRQELSGILFCGVLKIRTYA